MASGALSGLGQGHLEWDHQHLLPQSPSESSSSWWQKAHSHKSQLSAHVMQRVAARCILTGSRRGKPLWVRLPRPVVLCVWQPQPPLCGPAAAARAPPLTSPDLESPHMDTQKVALLPRSRPKGNIATKDTEILSVIQPPPTHEPCFPPPPAQKVL